jgi:hypothetical protein
MSSLVRALLVSVVIPVASCAPRPEAPISMSACRPTNEALSLDEKLDGMAGIYRLTLVATFGPQQGKQAGGALELWRSDTSDRSSDPRFRTIRPTNSNEFMPFVGSADLDFKSVGAAVRSTGGSDPSSRDPMYPGMMVTDDRRFDSDTQRRFREVTIHVSDNRRDNVVVTSVLPATSLLVRRIGKDGLFGAWGSGSFDDTAGGYWCAYRLNN